MGKILIIKNADFSAVALGEVAPIIGKIAINVKASPLGGGTTTGSGNYDEGAEVQITATAKSGYEFKQWNDGDTNATRTIIVGSVATTYTAIFVISPYLQPIKESVSGWGYVKESEQGRGLVDWGIRYWHTYTSGSNETKVYIYDVSSFVKKNIQIKRIRDKDTNNYHYHTGGFLAELEGLSLSSFDSAASQEKVPIDFAQTELLALSDNSSTVEVVTETYNVPTGAKYLIIGYPMKGADESIVPEVTVL